VCFQRAVKIFLKTGGIEPRLEVVVIAYVFRVVPLAGIEFCIQVIDFTVF
jgi:hypothetical protein